MAPRAVRRGIARALIALGALGAFGALRPAAAGAQVSAITVSDATLDCNQTMDVAAFNNNATGTGAGAVTCTGNIAVSYDVMLTNNVRVLVTVFARPTTAAPLGPVKPVSDLQVQAQLGGTTGLVTPTWTPLAATPTFTIIEQRYVRRANGPNGGDLNYTTSPTTQTAAVPVRVTLPWTTTPPASYSFTLEYAIQVRRCSTTTGAC